MEMVCFAALENVDSVIGMSVNITSVAYAPMKNLGGRRMTLGIAPKYMMTSVDCNGKL